MPGEAIQPLISAGPFLGVNTTESDIYLDPTKGRQMAAGDCETIPKSLTAKAGRLLALSAPNTLTGGQVGAIAEADLISSGGYGGGAVTSTSSVLGSIPIANYTSGTAARFIWGASTGAAILPTNAVGPGDLPFTRALLAKSGLQRQGTALGFSYLNDVYMDNYGCQTPADSPTGASVGSHMTHFFAPLSPGGIGGSFAAAGSAGGGSVGAGTYSYAITYIASYSTTQQQYGQETTAYFLPGSTVLAATGKITLTPTAPFVWSGTFTNDPSVNYVTAIYRSSLAQPTFFRLPVVATGSAAFVDTYSDAQIASNAQLTFNRDVPPVRPYPDFARTGPANTFITYNPGAPIAFHQGRMWYFVYVANSDTGLGAQLQIWYSNLNRPWEMDKVNNVFLVDQPPTNAVLNGPEYVPQPVPYPLVAGSNIYAYPNNVYLEVPSAQISLTSILLFWTTKKMYIMYGNSPATYLFQKFADIGCLSMQSVAYASASKSVGVFWMSENGVYFTDGQRIEYISEDIRSVIDGLSVSDRFNCCGFYSNFTYYISFPALAQTWAYRTTTKQWSGPYPYYTSFAISTPANPRLAPAGFLNGSSGMNQVTAVRPGTLNLDSWFVQVDTDLGVPQTVTYSTADQTGGNPHIEKEFTHIAITHKVQAAAITCTATVTVDDDSTKVCTVSFDLTKGPTQITTLSYGGLGGGPLRGYVASITFSFTTAVSNSTAPVEIKSVTVYGKPMSRNLTPTQGM